MVFATLLAQASDRVASAAGQSAAEANSGSGFWVFIGFIIVACLIKGVSEAIEEANRPKRFRVNGEAEEIR